MINQSFMTILTGGILMSWVSDVKFELTKLDVSQKSLKKFGFTIGFVFLIFGLLFQYYNIYNFIKIVFFTISLLLLFFAFLSPLKLKHVYKIWMGVAFFFGWFVSRFLLSILFIFVLTPIGLIAKIVNKNFLNISFKKTKTSYWIKIKSSNKINYDKMY